MKNIKLCITFTPHQWEYISTESKRRGVAAAEIVRGAISEARPDFAASDQKIISRLPAANRG